MNNEKEMTQKEDVEQDFKNMIASIFTKKVPGTHIDEDGLIYIPISKDDED